MRTRILLLFCLVSLGMMASCTKDPTASYSDGVLMVGDVSYKMIPVEEGTFMMGAERQDEDADTMEMPAHQVTLSSYLIGETEVTQALWKAVMGKNSATVKDDKLPMVEVNWGKCETFIEKLNELTGENFRLPTEAEWEYAARGGNMSQGYKYSGSNNIDEVAWYGGNSDGTAHIVGQKLPNELGLYDMSGNVFEWCQDRYDYYSRDSQTNPVGSMHGYNRVCRGGMYMSGAASCRPSSRTNSSPRDGASFIGFRLALTLSTKEGSL